MPASQAEDPAVIDLERERALTLGQAAELLPRRRGKRPAATTVWRWIVRGYRGVQLEALRAPAGWVTTAEAVGRFMATLAELERREKCRDLPAEVEAGRRRAGWADEVLRRHGIG